LSHKTAHFLLNGVFPSVLSYLGLSLSPLNQSAFRLFLRGLFQLIVGDDGDVHPAVFIDFLNLLNGRLERLNGPGVFPFLQGNVEQEILAGYISHP